MDKRKIKNSIVILLITCLFTLQSCDNELRNLAENPTDNTTPFPESVNPFDINVDGFDFLEKIQGHWVGTNLVIADDYPFFSFDYRPISSSHIHGIFEGGTGGNLFTSFFIANFKGTRTIMARNGGLLNGIYRTSYFVLDEVEQRPDGSKFYRLVDGHGGQRTMWMELRFKQDSLYFNSYTSRLGQDLPTRHMTFKAKKQNIDLAQTAATILNYPQNEVEFDFSNGFNESILQAAPGAKSATFLAQDQTGTQTVFDLAPLSGDPYTILDYNYLGYLSLNISRDTQTINKRLFLNLSKEPLTDTNGYFVNNLDAFNSILLFSELTDNQSEFLYTYLHPGTYYVNITADMDNDGTISSGDITHPLQNIIIEAGGQHQLNITNLNVVN